MGRTLGYHWVKSGYGLWLPGDERGHWSSAWDAEIGYIEPHVLHEGDAVRWRMAEERMTHPPMRLDERMQAVVEAALHECEAKSDWRIEAMTVCETHVHALLTYTTRDIENTTKWLADQTTKAVHRQTTHEGPVWCRGRWLEFVEDAEHWENLVAYIERHNPRK
ncbi:MAG: transposase [Phycisphaeraceae bacterium]